MAVICIGLILGIPLVDLGIKYYIEKYVGRGEEVPIMNGKMEVRHVHNEGMAFNFMERYPRAVKWISVIISVIFWIYFSILMGKKGRQLEKLSFSMLLGGALSNLYDRIVRKYVVDYFGFRTKWKKLTELTFNIGDLFIFAGGITVMLISAFRRR